MHTMYVIKFVDGSFARNTSVGGWCYTASINDATTFLLREDAEEVYSKRYDYPGEVVEVSVSNGGRSTVIK